MTQEEKQLLLIDLCARLPYYPIVRVSDAIGSEDAQLILNHIEFLYDEVCTVKPYLRPMSSMTEEEYDEWDRYLIPTEIHNIEGNLKGAILYDDFDSVLDWLNAHHFDYRYLIGKGLALEAPEGMYNIKEK